MQAKKLGGFDTDHYSQDILIFSIKQTIYPIHLFVAMDLNSSPPPSI